MAPDYEDCKVGKYIAGENLPIELQWMVYPWMKLTPVEFRIHKDRMEEYHKWLLKDPYGKISYLVGARAGFHTGPQDGTERPNHLLTGRITPEAEAYYSQPYVTWLYNFAINSARRTTEANEEIDLKAALSAEASAERRSEIQGRFATLHRRGADKTRMFSPSKNLTMVDTPTRQFCFSYDTLVGVYVHDLKMFYVSLADYEGTDYGNTTKGHLNRFLSGKWQDLAKQGKLLVTTQAELDRML